MKHEERDVNDLNYEGKREQRDLELALYNVISNYEKNSGCIVIDVSLDRLNSDPLDLSLMSVSTTVEVIRTKDSRIVCLRSLGEHVNRVPPATD